MTAKFDADHTWHILHEGTTARAISAESAAGREATAFDVAAVLSGPVIEVATEAELWAKAEHAASAHDLWALVSASKSLRAVDAALGNDDDYAV